MKEAAIAGLCLLVFLAVFLLLGGLGLFIK